MLPELITEGDTAEEALQNVHDALLAVLETYDDLGRTLPPSLQQDTSAGPVWLETLVAS